MDELKPCPFCGTTPEAREHDFGGEYKTWIVECGDSDCPALRVRAEDLYEADVITAWNTRPSEQPHGEAFAAGKILERNSGPVTKAMHELVAKWEKAGREHGVRQFTGNDHLLFANELKATLDAALGKSNG